MENPCLMASFRIKRDFESGGRSETMNGPWDQHADNYKRVLRTWLLHATHCYPKRMKSRSRIPNRKDTVTKPEHLRRLNNGSEHTKTTTKQTDKVLLHPLLLETNQQLIKHCIRQTIILQGFFYFLQNGRVWKEFTRSQFTISARY